MKSFRLFILLLLVGASTIPVGIISYYTIDTIYTQSRKQISHDLENVISLKQQILRDHLNIIAETARGLADHSAVKAVMVGVSSGADPKKSERISEALEVIEVFQNAHWGKLHHIFVTDTKGNVVMSPSARGAKEAHLDAQVYHADFSKVLSGTPTVTEFFGFTESDHFHQLYLQPVVVGTGVVGVVVMEVSIDHIQELLSKGMDLGETGNLRMISLDGVPIVNEIEKREKPLGYPEIEEARVNGKVVGEIERDDKTVLGVYNRDGDYPWILAVEIDADEAYADVYSLIHIIILLSVVIVVVMIVVGIIVSKRTTDPILEVCKATEQISKGDFGVSIKVTRKDEIGKLQQALHNMITGLSRAINRLNDEALMVLTSSKNLSTLADEVNGNMREVGDHSSSIAGATEELSSSSNHVAESTKETIKSVADVTRAIDEMSKAVSEVAENTTRGAALANSADEKTRVAMDIMSRLQDSSDAIGKVIEVINDIASQTNLLALNATIEAASAGEAGKGFAVVANEVKELAKQTATSTEEISKRIGDMRDATKSAVLAMQDVAMATSDVIGVSNAIAAATEQQAATGQDIQEIAAKTSSLAEHTGTQIVEISQATADVADRIITISQLSDHTVSRGEKVNLKSSQLVQMAESMQAIASSFSIPEMDSVVMEWSDELNNGIRAFDEEHKVILGYINELYNAMCKGHDRQVMVKILDGLLEFTERHFKHEEKYFEQVGYSEKDAHMAIHRRLEGDVVSYIESFKKEVSNTSDVSTDLILFLRDWLINHIMKVDRQYVPELKHVAQNAEVLTK